MAKRRRTADDQPTEAEPVTEGPWARARARALALAQTQATNDEIEAALRSEFCARRPVELPPSEVRRMMAGWGPALDDARTAGRLAPIEALLDAARDPEARDRTTAATFLARRQEAIDDLDRKLLAEVKRLMTLEPHEIVEELGRLQEQLGAV